MLLLEPHLCCLSCMFWVIVMLEHIFTAHILRQGGFHSRFLRTWLHSSFPRPSVVIQPHLAEKQPQSIMFPPSCLMVGVVFLGSKTASLSHLTRRVELTPKSSILVSSDHRIFSQSFSESSKCLFANFRRACTCAFLSERTLRVLHDLESTS